MKKKILSSLTMMAMLISVAALPVNAADEVAVSEAQQMLSEVVNVGDEASLEAIAAEQAQEMLANVLADDNMFYYPPYVQYSTQNISMQQHYMAAIPVYNTPMLMEAFNVYFYLNTNIVSGNPADISNFKIGSAYTDYATIKSVQNNAHSSGCRQITVKFNTRAVSSTQDSELFRYKLSAVDGKAISSEYALFKYTSENPTSPSFKIFSNEPSYILEKCIYSLADVDRDGDVDKNDSDAIMRAVVKLAGPSPDREKHSDLAYYDKIAFTLAADCDENGVIDILDVITANEMILESENHS